MISGLLVHMQHVQLPSQQHPVPALPCLPELPTCSCAGSSPDPAASRPCARDAAGVKNVSDAVRWFPSRLRGCADCCCGAAVSAPLPAPLPLALPAASAAMAYAATLSALHQKSCVFRVYHHSGLSISNAHFRNPVQLLSTCNT